MNKREQILKDIIYEAICYIEGDRKGKFDIHKLYLILTKVDNLRDSKIEIEKENEQ